MILFLSCSRSFMNRRSRLFFCLTCSISERRFAMVFAFVPAVPCVHWLCPLWFEKYYWLNHGHSLYFGFSLIYCISCIGRQIFNLFFQTTSSVLPFCLWYQLLYRWFDRYVFQVLIFPFRLVGSDLLVSLQNSPNPTVLLPVTMADPAPRVVMERPFPPDGACERA